MKGLIKKEEQISLQHRIVGRRMNPVVGRPADGSKVIVIDPEREYKELCENLDGRPVASRSSNM